MVNPVNIIHVTILLDNTYTDKIVYHAANKIAHPAPANLLMSENMISSGFFNYSLRWICLCYFCHEMTRHGFSWCPWWRCLLPPSPVLLWWVIYKASTPVQTNSSWFLHHWPRAPKSIRKKDWIGSLWRELIPFLFWCQCHNITSNLEQVEQVPLPPPWSTDPPPPLDPLLHESLSFSKCCQCNSWCLRGGNWPQDSLQICMANDWSHCKFGATCCE